MKNIPIFLILTINLVFAQNSTDSIIKLSEVNATFLATIKALSIIKIFPLLTSKVNQWAKNLLSYLAILPQLHIALMEVIVKGIRILE